MEPAAPSSPPPPPAAPKDAWRRYWLTDHGFLRAVWRNFHKLDNDVWRHNHPSPARLAQLKAMGAASVLSLRGPDNPLSKMEAQACADAGLAFHAVPLRAMDLPKKQSLLDLLDALRDMPKPLVVHCKSGSDRTGLAATIYLHAIKGQPLAQARKQISVRYFHNPLGKARVVNHFLDTYARANATTGISFEDWARDTYNMLDLKR